MSSQSAPFKSQGKEAIRRANLSAALTSVRLAGHQSRSELIKALRLSRTTVFELVGQLVGQLVELGLVTEIESPAASGVGRPSFVVSPDAHVGAIAVNPESDALSIGVVNLRGEILSRKRIATPEPLTPIQAAELIGGRQLRLLPKKL